MMLTNKFIYGALLSLGLSFSACSDGDEPAVSVNNKPVELSIKLIDEQGRDLLDDGYEARPYGQSIYIVYGNRSYTPIDATTPLLGTDQGFCDPMGEAPSPMNEWWKPELPFTGLTRVKSLSGNKLVFGKFDSSAAWHRKFILHYAANRTTQIEITNSITKEGHSQQRYFVDDKEIESDIITVVIPEKLQKQTIYSGVPGLGHVPVVIDLVNDKGISMLCPPAPGGISCWEKPVTITIDGKEYALDWKLTDGPKVMKQVYDWPLYAREVNPDIVGVNQSASGSEFAGERKTMLSPIILTSWVGTRNTNDYMIVCGCVEAGTHEIAITVGQGADARTSHCIMEVAGDYPNRCRITVDGTVSAGNYIRIPTGS